ncbi:MAG: ABC transporter substrate-binding protein, partial [Solirubrobacteraceae bacterium]
MIDRRAFIGSTATLAAALALGGCGSDDDSSATGPAPGDEFPVTVDGAFGPTRIPERPERVAAVGFLRDADVALALGVTPVAMATAGFLPKGLSPWVLEALGAAETKRLDTTNGLPFEQIAATRPDLILATDDYELERNRAKLARIAPTVAYAKKPGTDAWQVTAKRVGRALGRSQEATDLVRQIERRLRATREAHPELAGKTVTTGAVTDDGQFDLVSRDSDAAALFLHQLGMRLSPKITALPETQSGRSTISQEQLALLDADVLMLNYLSSGAQRALEARRLFKRL